MKLLSIILILFSLQSWVKADDIRDFQIEGMSVGDSLLEYMTVSEIENSKRNYFKNKRKYYVVAKFDGLENYQVVDIYLKSGDSKYIIRTLGGKIEYKNKDKCLSKKKEISVFMEGLFVNIKKSEAVAPHEHDKSKKSKVYASIFRFGKGKDNDPHVRVECSFFTKKFKKKTGFVDTLNVVAMTTEILDWVYSGYK